MRFFVQSIMYITMVDNACKRGEPCDGVSVASCDIKVNKHCDGKVGSADQQPSATANCLSHIHRAQ
jgi:hypothetical protein